MFEDTYRHKGLRNKLVDEVRSKGIVDERVLAAIGKVPRHLFMESAFVERAYDDNAFPIASGQTISQPYTVAFMTQLLGIKKDDKVLEIGTGSGYQTAVLLELDAKVYTIERHNHLYINAQILLNQLDYHPNFYCADGYLGLPKYSPFDKIIVTAAANSIPEALKMQLKIGGLMVIPVGNQLSQSMTTIVRLTESEFRIEKFGNFIFVPLLSGIVK